MNINYYDRKMYEIDNSMTMAFDHNKEHIIADKEWSFEIANDQKEVIEHSINMFKEWFENRFQNWFKGFKEKLVFKSIEFEPFWNGNEDAFTATIKFELNEY